jgi:glycosyltransferase involved in cell wall biosynthesis
MSDTLYIVMPAYNEEANIEDVVKDWYPVVEKLGGESRLVIFNDGSKDHTYEKLMELAETRPQLIPVNKENEGHGPTLQYAYHYAIDAGADYIFQTDSDGQTIPGEFWQLWDKREQAGLICGQRKGRQDGFSRIVVTKVLKLVVRLLFHVNVLDANVPFRLMKAAELKEILPLIPDHYNLTNVIVSVIYCRMKKNVDFTPITFRPRQGGVNSINLKKIFKIGWKALSDFSAIQKNLKAKGI